VIGGTPIAACRTLHKLPEINTELYAHGMAKYVSTYPPSVFSQAQPGNLAGESGRRIWKIRASF
jgi:hypothetical protein